MPLSASAQTREPIHTRAIECRSFVRDDGLVDIEGHLTDVKSYSFPNEYRGEIKAGEPLHDMWIRLTVDVDFVIRAVETVMDGTPFGLCSNILPAFDQLVGLRIEAGWNRQVRKRLGGVRGCTHLVDLLQPMATVAFHTVQWSRAAPHRPGRGVETSPGRGTETSPGRGAETNAGGNAKTDDGSAARLPLNSCHAWASDGEIVRDRYPGLYTGK